MNKLFEPGVQPFVQRIQKIHPDFTVNSARWLGSGQNNDVILLNDSWIFRFPRNALGAIHLETEVAVLRYLQGQLPLEIPYPEYVYIVPEDLSRSFVGYRMISGVPLTRESATVIDDSDLNVVAKQVADFLQTLHTLSIPKDIAKIRNGSTISYWSNMFERIQRLLFPHMRREAREQVCTHFVSFLQASKNHNFNVALIHGDFGSRNILLSENRKRVVAVIDWGSVGIGDPAVDYAAASTIHPRMLELIVNHNSNVHKYINRIEFYKGTFALQEALYGAESGDENAFRSGLKEYV